MNPKVLQLGFKAAASVVVATVIGYLIKAENMLDDHIDSKYAPTKDEEEDPS